MGEKSEEVSEARSSRSELACNAEVKGSQFKMTGGAEVKSVRSEPVSVSEVKSSRSDLACGVDVESVYRQLGQAGRFHARVLALVALAAVQVGLLHTTYIFLAADVHYR